VIRVELPQALCSDARQNSSVVIEGSVATIGDALSVLGRSSPAALDRIMDERGDVRRHVNVFVNGENIRFLHGLDTPAPADATILILAAVSGG
jgi:molybdopterin synthase sulfur carrier subunit